MASVPRSSSGVNLRRGKRLLNGDYDLEVDIRPEELKEEFLDEYNWSVEEADGECLGFVDDARQFVIDEIVHVNAVARNEGVDPEVIDDERLTYQMEEGVLKMSNVWNSSWQDMRVGTCQERAITLHSLYNELGIASRYHEGFIDIENEGYFGHAWTTVPRYISDPSISGDGVIPVEDAGRYKEREVWVR